MRSSLPFLARTQGFLRTHVMPWALFLFLAAASTYGDRGALNPDVTQATILQTICTPGYAKNVSPAASYTNDVKRMLLERERIGPAVASNFELDHIIPLSPGGHPPKRQNLALQGVEGKNGAKRKDRIEVKLQCLVCSGRVSLAEAQHQIATDWHAAYRRYALVNCRRRAVEGKT